MVAIKISALYVLATLAVAANAAPTPVANPGPGLWSDFKSYIPTTWNPFSRDAASSTTSGLSSIEQDRAIFMGLPPPPVRTSLPPWPKAWLMKGEKEEDRVRALSPVVGNHGIVSPLPNLAPDAPMLTPQQRAEHDARVKAEAEERQKEIEKQRERELEHEKKIRDFYLTRQNYWKAGLPGAFPDFGGEDYVSDTEYETANESQPENSATEAAQGGAQGGQQEEHQGGQQGGQQEEPQGGHQVGGQAEPQGGHQVGAQAEPQGGHQVGAQAEPQVAQAEPQVAQAEPQVESQGGKAMGREKENKVKEQKAKEEEKEKAPKNKTHRRRNKKQKNKSGVIGVSNGGGNGAIAPVAPSSPRPRPATPVPHASFFHHSLNDRPTNGRNARISPPPRPESRMGFRPNEHPISNEDEESSNSGEGPSTDYPLPPRPQSRLSFYDDDDEEPSTAYLSPPTPYARGFSARLPGLPSIEESDEEEAPFHAQIPTIHVTPPSDDPADE